MSLQLIKCKVCGKTLSEPERVIGDPPRAHFGRIVQRLQRHIESRLKDEQLSPSKPHTEAWSQCLVSVITYQNYLLSHLFELPSEMEQDRETVRAGFAASLAQLDTTAPRQEPASNPTPQLVKP